MNPPRTQIKSVLPKQPGRAGFHNQRGGRLWVLPQDVPLHIHKYNRSQPGAHRYFQRFFAQIERAGITCLFLQVPLVSKPTWPGNVPGTGFNGH